MTRFRRGVARLRNWLDLNFIVDLGKRGFHFSGVWGVPSFPPQYASPSTNGLASIGVLRTSTRPFIHISCVCECAPNAVRVGICRSMFDLLAGVCLLYLFSKVDLTRNFRERRDRTKLGTAWEGECGSRGVVGQVFCKSFAQQIPAYLFYQHSLATGLFFSCCRTTKRLTCNPNTERTLKPPLRLSFFYLDNNVISFSLRFTRKQFSKRR